MEEFKVHKAVKKIFETPIAANTNRNSYFFSDNEISDLSLTV